MSGSVWMFSDQIDDEDKQKNMPGLPEYMFEEGESL